MEVRDEQNNLRIMDELFGIEGRALHVLLEHPDREFTKKDFREEAQVSATFMSKYYDKLQRYHMIVGVRKIGKAELFKANLENELLRLLKKWYQRKMRKIEMQKIIEIYEKEYKGKESREEIALLKLLGNMNASIPKKIEAELERRGFILTKDDKRYWTSRGFEVAKSLKNFEKIVAKERA